LKKYGVRVGEVVRKALEQEVLKLEEQELRKMLDEICTKLAGKIDEKDVVAAVRAGRETR